MGNAPLADVRSLDTVMSQLEEWIRSGRTESARRELTAIGRGKVPRSAALRLASLARRAGLPSLALRWLNPIVRPTARSPKQATPAERAEYAASLTRVGAVTEALRILRELESDAPPEALLFHAFALFTRCEYGTAVPLLRKYLAAPGLTDYAALVGRVNLAAALVFEHRHDEAREVLEALRRDTGHPQLKLLHGNSLELSAQQAVFERKLPEARRFLEQARTHLESAGGLDELFVRKWLAVVECFESPRRRSALGALDAVRAEARQRRHWETVRECDRFAAIALGDAELAAKVYFGTPYASYRRRLEIDLAGRWSPPETYHWSPSGKPAGPRSVLHLLERGGPGLDVGRAMHRLLTALASDFYRPHRVAALHSLLYPRDFFNPQSSPTRVHQIVKRTKRWMSQHGIALSIVIVEGAYHLAASRACTLAVPRGAAADRGDWLLQRLRERFHGDPFSAQEAATAWEVSSRSAVRLLAEAVRAGKLQRLGAAATTRYRVPPA